MDGNTQKNACGRLVHCPYADLDCITRASLRVLYRTAVLTNTSLSPASGLPDKNGEYKHIPSCWA